MNFQVVSYGLCHSYARRRMCRQCLHGRLSLSSQGMELVQNRRVHFNCTSRIQRDVTLLVRVVGSPSATFHPDPRLFAEDLDVVDLALCLNHHGKQRLFSSILHHLCPAKNIEL